MISLHPVDKTFVAWINRLIEAFKKLFINCTWVATSTARNSLTKAPKAEGGQPGRISMALFPHSLRTRVLEQAEPSDCGI